MKHENFEITGDPAQRAALFGALAAATLLFKPIVRSKTVRVEPQNSKAYSFTYAPIESVIDATASALAANGLSVIQPYYTAQRPVIDEVEGVRAEPNGWHLRTMLLHSGGGTLETSVHIPREVRYWDNFDKVHKVRPRTAQELGSELTYQRRYGLQCILGINAEDDDDGNHAAGNATEPAEPVKSTQKTPPAAPAAKAQPAKPAEQKPPAKPPEPAKSPEPVKAAEPPPKPASLPPPPPEPEPAAPAPAEEPLFPDDDEPPAHDPADDLPRTQEQNTAMAGMLRARGANRASVERAVQAALGRGPSTPENPLTVGEARRFLAYLEANPDAGKPTAAEGGK